VLVDPVPGSIISIGVWLISRIGIVALTLLVAVPLGLQLGVIVGNVVFGVLFRARKPKKSYVALCDDVVEHEAKDLKAALLHGPVKDVRIGYRVSSTEYRVSSIECPDALAHWPTRSPCTAASPGRCQPGVAPPGLRPTAVGIGLCRALTRIGPLTISPARHTCLFARFLNKLLSQLWPHLSPAIHRKVMAQAKQPIREALAKIPLIGGRVLKTIRIDVLDLGTRPFRVDSIKSYTSSPSDNWVMTEAALLYGGDMRVRVVIEVSFGVFTVDVPVEVANFQLKALARMTLYPLVEQLPCVGGVTLSLLEQPTVDFDLHILDSPDLLALPPIPVLLRFVQNLVVGKMLVYPNEMSFPVLPNYGLPKPPVGICRVAVKYGGY